VSAELGIATLSPMKFGRKAPSASLDLIESTASGILDAGKRLVSLGGEHTITAPLIRAHLKRWPGLSVLQIDAHSDLRESYGGTPLSHACVMARICESVDPRRIVQAGIRAQCAEEAAFIREKGITTIYAHQMRPAGNADADGWIDRAIGSLTDDVYVTFDVDGLDPSIMPSTGTPEPDGLSWGDAMTLLRETGKRKNVVGFDVVELSPIRGIHHADYTAAKLVSKMMNYCFTSARN
jgi:agmatinase